MRPTQIPHKETILDAIQVRMDTIIDDPTSSDDFESVESLELLEEKIQNDHTNFTPKEKNWLIEEIENRMDVVPRSLEQLLGIVREQNQKRSFQQPTNTPTFIFNDGGRAAAGYKGMTGDCVARAVAIASGKPYQEVYDRLANGNATQKKTKRGSKRTGQHTASHGINVKRKWFQEYMKSIGFKWIPTMQIGQGCKVHLRADELPKGRLVVSVSKHYTTMIDGVIHDTYDCSREGNRCVYGYFTKQ